MGEIATSKEDAAMMKRQINALVNVMHRQGFGRGQIGCCMAGIGLALAQVHCGHDETMRIIETVSALLQSDISEKN